QSHSLRKEIEQLKSKNASLMVDSLLANALEKDGYKLLVSVVDDFDKDALGILVDQLKDKLGSALVYIINKSADKVNLIASATKDIVKDKNIHCGKLIKETASLLGGNGGGRPDIAQGAGKDASKIDQVITYLKNLD
ncbi:TPA: alanine--tRNA ligase, partial [bacterium]|nr:alanine--tRNA ligase [bacterium]